MKRCRLSEIDFTPLFAITPRDAYSSSKHKIKTFPKKRFLSWFVDL